MLNYKNRIYGKTKEIDPSTLKKLFHNKKLDFITIALLFGSRAREKHHNRSDYDFALLMDSSADDGWGIKAKAYNLIGDLFDLDDCDFDIVDLQHSDNIILDSIKENYIILKGDKNEISRLLK